MNASARKRLGNIIDRSSAAIEACRQIECDHILFQNNWKIHFCIDTYDLLLYLFPSLAIGRKSKESDLDDESIAQVLFEYACRYFLINLREEPGKVILLPPYELELLLVLYAEKRRLDAWYNYFLRHKKSLDIEDELEDFAAVAKADKTRKWLASEIPNVFYFSQTGKEGVFDVVDEKTEIRRLESVVSGSDAEWKKQRPSDSTKGIWFEVISKLRNFPGSDLRDAAAIEMVFELNRKAQAEKKKELFVLFSSAETITSIFSKSGVDSKKLGEDLYRKYQEKSREIPIEKELYEATDIGLKSVPFVRSCNTMLLYMTLSERFSNPDSEANRENVIQKARNARKWFEIHLGSAKDILFDCEKNELPLHDRTLDNLESDVLDMYGLIQNSSIARVLYRNIKGVLDQIEEGKNGKSEGASNKEGEDETSMDCLKEHIRSFDKEHLEESRLLKRKTQFVDVASETLSQWKIINKEREKESSNTWVINWANSLVERDKFYNVLFRNLQAHKEKGVWVKYALRYLVLKEYHLTKEYAQSALVYSSCQDRKLPELLIAICDVEEVLRKKADPITEEEQQKGIKIVVDLMDDYLKSLETNPDPRLAWVGTKLACRLKTCDIDDSGVKSRMKKMVDHALTLDVRELSQACTVNNCSYFACLQNANWISTGILIKLLTKLEGWCEREKYSQVMDTIGCLKMRLSTCYEPNVSKAIEQVNAAIKCFTSAINTVVIQDGSGTLLSLVNQHLKDANVKKNALQSKISGR